MEVLLVLAPFAVAGIAVLFVAMSGGVAAAREAYLTRGPRLFKIVIPVLYVALGVAVPAAVIAARDEAEGGVGPLRTEELPAQAERGKELFRQTCASCHNLDAVQARGVTGPDLDEIGGLDQQRVLNAIERGGTGTGRMPADLLPREDAEDVAFYVARVAGR